MSPQRFAAATGLTPAVAGAWLPAIDIAWREWHITDPREQAMWLAQCGHESGGFLALRENLNYSADALRRVWPRRFPAELADAYARQPQRIADRAYADRMGNAGEASGDGWRYRGGGLIQLTGRGNFRAAGAALGVALESSPELIERPSIAARAACWFWAHNRIGQYARTGNLDAVSDLINLGRITAKRGDAHGYTDRAARFTRALTALGIH